MKRYTLLLALLAVLLRPFAGEAAPVRVDRAQAAAAAFFTQSAATRSVPQLQLVWQGESAATRAAGDPALYIFNRTDAPGFVIVAGDDAALPVLGYSFRNRFGDVNDMPANLRTWLELLEREVLRLRAAGGTSAALWQQPMTAGDPVRQLQTAQWGQDAPYNNECPEYAPRKRAVTGCTQTAAAIVMKYNQWPDAGVGTLPGYTTATRKIKVEGRTLGAAYDWASMRDSYRPTDTDAGAAAVASLMADLGVMTQADYGAETGAYTSDLLAGLVEHMKYSKQARLLMRYGYTEAEWIALMKAEIDAGRPVIYGGVAQKVGGHQFILDGYTTDDLFGVNWGWEGQANGYYSLGNLDPQIDGKSMYNDSFSFAQNDAIVGLVKDPDGTSQYADLLAIASAAYNGTMYYGLSASTERFQQGDDFTMSLMWVANGGVAEYNGEVCLTLYDRHGAEKEHKINKSALNMQIPSYILKGYMTIPCSITQALRPGDYIAASYLERSSNRWLEMRAFDADAVARIVVMAEAVSPETIAASTSLAYDRETHRLTLQTIADLQCRVTGADGKKLFEQTTSDAALTIDASGWSGSCVLTLTPDDGTPYTLRLQF